MLGNIIHFVALRTSEKRDGQALALGFAHRWADHYISIKECDIKNFSKRVG